MKINLSEFFPVSSRELAIFEQLVEKKTESPPEGGFDLLMAAKDANEKLLAFQEGRRKPTSFGMLVEILANALGKNRFRLVDELQTNASTWNKVILDQDRPDIIPARTYATFANLYNLSFNALKSALEGSFQLFKSGGYSSSAMFARSDRKTTKNIDVTAAVHELLRKAGKTTGPLDKNATAFLKEVESCMKTSR